jgi:hypothetical protein
MSRESQAGAGAKEEVERSQGPNLTLLYSLLGLALLTAMAIGALIVLPFYRHRH